MTLSEGPHAISPATGRPALPEGQRPPPTQVFAEHRDFLVGVAYRILGRMADAEDVVQEAWLRWQRANSAEVQDPRAFLVRVTTRLAIDRLRRIKARREEYVGPWLPEPVLSSQLLPSGDPSEEVELAESVSLALLVVLETLSPLERAVFVLHEVFGLSHPEVAEAVGRSEAAVRQVASRARAHVQARRPRYQSDPSTRREVTERFLAACATGNVDTLMAVLAPDVTLVADSGGRARAPRVPLHGATAVARFLAAIGRPENVAKFLASIGIDLPPAAPSASTGEITSGPAGETTAETGVPDLLATIDVRVAGVNGAPSIVAAMGDQVLAVIDVDVVDDRVATVHLIANPQKLARLTPPPMSRTDRGAAS